MHPNENTITHQMIADRFQRLANWYAEQADLATAAAEGREVDGCKVQLGWGFGPPSWADTGPEDKMSVSEVQYRKAEKDEEDAS